MSIDMLKGKRVTAIDGDFDDEELMKLFASLDIAVRPKRGKAAPLIDQLEKLGAVDLGPLRKQYFVPDDDDDERPQCWQAVDDLHRALTAMRSVLDHGDAPFFVEQIWADAKKPLPMDPGRAVTDEMIEAVDDLLARVKRARGKKAERVRLSFDPALL